MEGNNRSFHPVIWEFKAPIQVSTVTMIGRSVRSRKQTQFIPFRDTLQFTVLTRMCVWFIINTQGGWVSADVR